jgi:uncharacterized protein (DUF427 family)
MIGGATRGVAWEYPVPIPVFAHITPCMATSPSQSSGEVAEVTRFLIERDEIVQSDVDHE